MTQCHLCVCNVFSAGESGLDSLVGVENFDLDFVELVVVVEVVVVAAGAVAVLC